MIRTILLVIIVIIGTAWTHGVPSGGSGFLTNGSSVILTTDASERLLAQ